MHHIWYVCGVWGSGGAEAPAADAGSASYLQAQTGYGHNQAIRGALKVGPSQKAFLPATRRTPFDIRGGCG